VHSHTCAYHARGPRSSFRAVSNAHSTRTISVSILHVSQPLWSESGLYLASLRPLLTLLARSHRRNEWQQSSHPSHWWQPSDFRSLCGSSHTCSLGLRWWRQRSWRWRLARSLIRPTALEVNNDRRPHCANSGPSDAMRTVDRATPFFAAYAFASFNASSCACCSRCHLSSSRASSLSSSSRRCLMEFVASS
jgi:hypothetical protein